MRTRTILKTSVAVLIVVTLVFSGLGFIYREALFVGLAEQLVTNKKLEKSDSISVLSGGEPERMLEAIDLYKSGYAPRIILTRADKPENLDVLNSLGINDPEPHEVNLEIASRLGIPRTVITVLEPRVNSTFSEIKLLVDYSVQREFKSVILVTSKTHTTRSYKIFRHLAGKKIKVIPQPSRYDTFDTKNWWKKRRTIKEVLYEYQKLANFFLIERW